MTVVPLEYTPPGDALDRLPQLIDLSARIAKTEFVPAGLRGRPEAVLACLLTGHELGLGWMASLKLIVVIEGRPSLTSEGMRGLVLRAGHDVVVSLSSDDRAVVNGRRAGSKEWTTFTWTLADAQRAGLAGRDNWRKYPKAMLLARASADCCRALFPDVLMGLPSSDEVRDYDDDGGAGAPPAARQADETPASTPVVDAGADVPAPGTPSPHDASVARRIHARLAEVLDEADDVTRMRHALVAIVTRRRETGPVVSSSELDGDEQRRLLDLLAQIEQGAAALADTGEQIEMAHLDHPDYWCEVVLGTDTVRVRDGDGDEIKRDVVGSWEPAIEDQTEGGWDESPFDE